MILNKIEMLRLESAQKETLAITYEFRQALLKHFEVVDANARSLINGRWGDENGSV